MNPRNAKERRSVPGRDQVIEWATQAARAHAAGDLYDRLGQRERAARMFTDAYFLQSRAAGVIGERSARRAVNAGLVGRAAAVASGRVHPSIAEAVRAAVEESVGV